MYIKHEHATIQDFIIPIFPLGRRIFMHLISVVRVDLIKENWSKCTFDEVRMLLSVAFPGKRIGTLHVQKRVNPED